MTTPTISITGDRLRADGLQLCDADLVRFVTETDEDERASLLERALRVGLIALRNAGVSVNVDYVEKEFARLVRRVEEVHERAATAMETSLRETFADEEGRLPRTLDRFLGDRGTLRAFVDDLFDDERRDSAIGRIRSLLAGYMDGDGAVLARLLDPTRDGSPLHAFRDEMRDGLREVTDRLSRLEAGDSARADERARGTAKGTEFEDVVEERLGVIARACGDLVERCGTVAGDSVRGRTGDFVLAVNPGVTRGLEVRVAIEAKSGPVGLTAIGRQLEGSRRNRRASVAVAVFRTGCAPTGCAPLTLHGEDVLCELDPEDLDDPGFEAAIRLARALAIASVRRRSVEIDGEAVRRQLEAVRNRLGAVRGMKSKLTSIAGCANEVAAALDEMRADVLDCVAAVEGELRACGEDGPAALTA